MKSGLWIWIGLVAIVCAGSAARWYAAYHLYNPALNTRRQFSGDEFVYLRLGDRLIKEGRYDTKGLVEEVRKQKDVSTHAYLEAPLFKHPPLFPLLVGLARKMFWGVYGASIYPSLFMGALGLAATYWLAREAGLGPLGGLLAALLLAISPAHWICSSRIWLDSTLVAFVILACAAHLRALEHPRWYIAMGLFWGLAFLTKYTAFAGWFFMTAAALLKPETRRNRMFWLGQGIAAAVFLPWLALRFCVEGSDVIFFWKSGVEDWRTLGRLWKWVWIAPVVAAAVWIWARAGQRGVFARAARDPRLLAFGTLAFIVLVFVVPLDLDQIPWFGFSPNQLAGSSRDFYLTHQILFEPVCWWGLIGLVVYGGSERWNLLRAGWLGFFLFLTAWGNFQSRYGLPLIPFEEVFAAGVLGCFLAEGKRNKAAVALAVLWLVLSWARSVWIMGDVGIANQYFYF